MIDIIQHFDIPSSTPQQRKLGNGNSHPTSGLRYARAAWRAFFEKFAPASPYKGPVGLYVELTYGTLDAKKKNTYKTTRPDGDNLLKIIKDAMTKAGYWSDDNQIADEHIVRRWGYGDYSLIHFMVWTL